MVIKKDSSSPLIVVTHRLTSSPFFIISRIFVPEISMSYEPIQLVWIPWRSQISFTQSLPVNNLQSAICNLQLWNICNKFSHHRSSSGTSARDVISIFSWSSSGILARMISSRSWTFHGFSPVPDLSAEPMMRSSLSKSFWKIFSTILMCPIWNGWNRPRNTAVFVMIIA